MKKFRKVWLQFFRGLMCLWLILVRIYAADSTKDYLFIKKLFEAFYIHVYTWLWQLCHRMTFDPVWCQGHCLARVKFFLTCLDNIIMICILYSEVSLLMAAQRQIHKGYHKYLKWEPKLPDRFIYLHWQKSLDWISLIDDFLSFIAWKCPAELLLCIFLY